MMRVLVIGGGGREYALARRIAESPLAECVYVCPGNGGMERFAECVPISATDIVGIVRFAAEKHIDFAVVTPDDPLALGLADRLRAIGIDCFGPSAAAARIESHKAEAKKMMQKYNIPTAAFEVFEDYPSALKYAAEGDFPVVIKADGLALGKGVVIAHNADEARAALTEIMLDRKFGASGDKVVVEEFLTGAEVSVLALTDGLTIRTLPSVMDHKTIGEGGTGANTGGMGAIAPNPFYTDDIADECMKTIFLPTIAAMRAEGRPFSGCLYFGLMLTPKGAKVIEYNCRFGDPETQAVLPLINTDILEMLAAVERGWLADLPLDIKNEAVCAVTLASGGYPSSYQKGVSIEFGNANNQKDVEIVHAGTRKTFCGYVTNGGRVLNAVARANTLEQAIKQAYAACDEIKYDNMYYRRDIGAAALAKLNETKQSQTDGGTKK